MTAWRVQPAEVQSVLRSVQHTAEELGQEVTQARFESVLDGLTWGGALTEAVGAAAGTLVVDQVRNVQAIADRIHGGTVGVANAVIAYANGQEEMAGSYQTELARSAESGDFSFFVDRNGGDGRG